MNDIEIGFGDRLKNERKKYGFTQKELADLTNLTPLSIAQYENGRSIPSIKFIFALERLGFDVMFIVANENSDPQKNKFSSEVITKVAQTIDALENQIGEKLESDVKVKAVIMLAKYFRDNDHDENLSPMQIFSKLVLLKVGH